MQRSTKARALRSEGNKKGEQNSRAKILRPSGKAIATTRPIIALARALHDEGVKHALVTVLENLTGLTTNAFWCVLDNRNGHRCACADIPRSVRDLIDDPCRSVASELRRVGGFEKATMPFSEFLWADFLRRRLERKLIESDFDYPIEKALKLALDLGADYLPG